MLNKRVIWLIAAVSLQFAIAPQYCSAAKKEQTKSGEGAEAAVTSPTLASDSSPEKEKEIRELLQLTGAGAMGKQVISQMVPTLKQMVPDAPADFWVDFEKRTKGEDLVEIVVPIYDKYLTREDVQQTVAFFKSPAGKKLSRVQPQMVAESMKAGQAWGENLAKEVIKDLKAKGYKVPEGFE